MGEPQEDDRDEEDGLGELLERVFVSAEPVDRFVEIGNCSGLVRCLVVPRPEFDVLKFLQTICVILYAVNVCLHGFFIFCFEK